MTHRNLAPHPVNSRNVALRARGAIALLGAALACAEARRDGDADFDPDLDSVRDAGGVVDGAPGAGAGVGTPPSGAASMRAARDAGATSVPGPGASSGSASDAGADPSDPGVQIDAGSPRPDADTTEDDAGVSELDAGAAPPDGGSPRDAGMQPPDTEPSDAGMEPPDAGSPPDAGGRPDAGTPPDPVCERGALRCEGTLIARCSEDETAYELVRDCRERSRCERAASECAAASCAPDELGCGLADLVSSEPGVHAFAVGTEHTCAVIAGGAVRCWGSYFDGRLGYASSENIGDTELPSSVAAVDAGGPAVELAAGSNHTCALLANGEVRCWGRGTSGRLGYGNTNAIGLLQTPASAGSVSLGGPAVQVVAGGGFTCALLLGGAVRCWGSGTEGKLGRGLAGVTAAVGDDELPDSVAPVDLGGPAVFLAAGPNHTCAILRTGAVRCWGRANGGQLGYASTRVVGDDETPAAAGSVALGGRAVQLSASGAHTCAVLADGAVRCWGANLDAQLGNDGPAIGDDETPDSAPVLPLGQPVRAIATGQRHGCALLADASVRCWGYGVNGQLGNALSVLEQTLAEAPPRVELGGPALRIDAYDDFGCALLATRELVCWGVGSAGQLGYGSASNAGDDETPASLGPVPVF